MRRLTAAQVHARKVEELGLDAAALDLASIEAIAGALRRGASFLCPCPASRLIRGVVEPLRGLVADLRAVRDLVEETLEAMVAYGDFLELPEVAGLAGSGGATLLYAAPPGFVARENGTVLLFGVPSEWPSTLLGDLEPRVDCAHHVRRLRPVGSEDLADILGELGLRQLSTERWLGGPSVDSAAGHVSRIDRLLDAAGPSGDVEGLRVLDPERSVRYYPGRWSPPSARHSGRFVARRSRAYGADLWCYVQADEGSPEKILDLPIPNSRWRGCDEAWHLQMALDARHGEPQQFRIRPGPSGTQVLELYSPVPMWAQRRWDAIGEPVPATGCLLAYRLAASEIREEVRFARESLWLRDASANEERGDRRLDQGVKQGEEEE